MSNQNDLGVFHIDISNMKLIIDLKKIADVINVANGKTSQRTITSQ